MSKVSSLVLTVSNLELVPVKPLIELFIVFKVVSNLLFVFPVLFIISALIFLVLISIVSNL